MSGGYEEPVNEIAGFLRSKKRVVVIRDRDEVRFADDIRKFMKDAAKCDRIIVVHSDKYWRSPYCIYELHVVDEELRKKRDKSLVSLVIPVEHQSSGITRANEVERLTAFWLGFDGDLPAGFPLGANALRAHASAIVQSYGGDLSNLHDFNILWVRGDAALREIAERLGIEPARGAR